MLRLTVTFASLATLLWQLSVASAQDAAQNSAQNTLLCCSALALAVGVNKVFYSNSAGYAESAASYFAQQEGQLNPYCYVKPTSATDVSNAVKALVKLNSLATVCPFAVRGGGHHPLVGIANIHAGITIDLTGMSQTTVSYDKSIASIGAGARWESVYSTVVPMGLGVLGGRIGDIGVGGLTIGGGISYFGAAYGFACDMVHNFEVVLASGAIVNANSGQNSDLFKALKGGGNNFGIVTRFDVKTFPLDDYWGGNLFYSSSKSPQLIDAFTSFITNPDFDNKAGILLVNIYAAGVGQVSTCNLAYTEAVQNPPIFANFTTNIPNIESQLLISNLSDFAAILGSNTPDGIRQTTITATVRPNGALLQQIYQMWQATISSVSSADNLLYAMTYQPIPANMIKQGPLNGGNSLGLSGGPLVVVTLTVQYTSSSSDSNITSTSRQFITSVMNLASQTGDLNPWIYLNYADVTQPVISSYGSDNVQNLKAVSSRVDPKGFFQKVQPGGFKL